MRRQQIRTGSSRSPILNTLKTLAASLALIAATTHAADVNTTGLAVTDDTVKVGILHSVTGTMAINPSMYQKLPYDPVRDFAAITLVAKSPPMPAAMAPAAAPEG